MNEAMNVYLAFLKQSKGAAKSVNANINALKSFSHFIGFEDMQLQRERSHNTSAEVLTPAEQETFLRCTQQQEWLRDRALALILFYTGMRISNVAHLNVDDILVNEALTTGDTFVFIKLNNGTKISLDKSTSLVLKQWLMERAKSPYAEGTSALWLTKEGERLSVSGMAFVIRRIGKQAQLVLSAELLRRTCLFNTTTHFSKNERPSEFCEYVSIDMISSYPTPQPFESNINA